MFKSISLLVFCLLFLVGYTTRTITKIFSRGRPQKLAQSKGKMAPPEEIDYISESDLDKDKSKKRRYKKVVTRTKKAGKVEEDVYEDHYGYPEKEKKKVEPKRRRRSSPHYRRRRSPSSRSSHSSKSSYHFDIFSSKSRSPSSYRRRRHSPESYKGYEYDEVRRVP